MTYYGGKDGSGVAQRLINQIPPHRVFISAFLGDCAVLRRIRPAEMSIGIDRDRANIDRWLDWQKSIIREHWQKTRFLAKTSIGQNLRLYCCDAIEWLRHAFGFHLVPTPFLSADWGSPLPGTDAISVGLVPEGDSHTFLYCDPPYRLECRQDRRPRYRFEMTDEDHVKLLATLNWLDLQTSANIMVHHYPCEMYADALADWRTWTYRATTRRGTAVEQVWCNYREPTALHDTRHLGRDKRQREAIRRRRQRWRDRLDRLDPLERQALLDGLA